MGAYSLTAFPIVLFLQIHKLTDIGDMV